MRLVFKLYAVIVGIASTIHMLLVFISESFYRHSLTFYEPNVPLAYFELQLSIIGVVGLVILLYETFAVFLRQKFPS